MEKKEDTTAIPPGSAILRAFRILEALGDCDEPPQLAGLAKAVDLPKPTVLRILATLEHAGLVCREPAGKRYSFGERINGFAGKVLLSSPVRSPRHAILEELVEQVGETCNLAIPFGAYARYVDRVEVPSSISVKFGPGSRVPLHASASGKIFLGYMPRRGRDRFLAQAPLIAHTPNTLVEPARIVADLAAVRENGFAVDKGEFLRGVSCVAVPVRNGGNKVVAAVAVTAPEGRASLDQMMECLPAMRSAAQALGATLDW
ncbi:MAG: IclR family transcriptional regulator [Burkholderiaceae bacterium]|nr:IclR family transcriptional regulator [Burkholderiaceae bacterium]